MFPDERVAEVINERFVPVRVHVKEQSEEFQRLGERYNAQWTPTQLFLEPDGTERHRIEGFLPTDEFLAQLNLGLAKAAFARRQYEPAEREFHRVVERYADTSAAPEAQYWEGVARYKRTNDPEALSSTARRFTTQYQGTEWAKRASVWAK